MANSGSAQCRRLLERLARGSANTFDLQTLGICRPGARVSDLRAAGHEIRTHRKPARDAQGVEHRGVATYYLVGRAGTEDFPHRDDDQ